MQTLRADDDLMIIINELFINDKDLAAAFPLNPLSDNHAGKAPEASQEITYQLPESSPFVTKPLESQKFQIFPSPESADKSANPFPENFDKKISETVTESKITDKQLRVLNRKHLLLMVRDLEKELEQIKLESQNLLVTFEAGSTRKDQIS